MSTNHLASVAAHLMANDRGLLAIDESIATCNRRFAALGIAQTAEKRREWRERIVTTPGLNRSISGIIFCDETIHQTTRLGTSFPGVLAENIIAGIKVDLGTADLPEHPGEMLTQGLDGLAERLEAYLRIGACFAKWRNIFVIGEGTPSAACIETNARTLALYAATCQRSGLVPIVEPEILMTGRHSLERCADATEAVLRAVFRHADEQGVMLESMILKPNMVLAGLDCPVQPGLDDVADATLTVLLRCVPSAVGGVAFLSGGQPPELATARLNAMIVRFRGRMPWPLAFSFGRAIQQPALEIWQGRDDRVQPAQAALAHRAQCNHAARGGVYQPSMEHFADAQIAVAEPAH